MAKGTKRRVKVEVPANTAEILQLAQQKLVQLMNEHTVFKALMQGYVQGLKLDPAKDYQFVSDGEKSWAVEIDKKAPPPTAPPTPIREE